MRSNDLYARLELLTPDCLPDSTTVPRRQRRARLQARLRQWAHALLDAWVGSKEPRITRRCDPDGNLYFAVYDPYDHSHHTFACETALRVWLEQRYYL